MPPDNFIVTIARQYGSGGCEIGRAIADELGVKCYDAQIISRMAEESDYSESHIASNEQKVESHTREEFYKRYAGAVADQDLPRVEQLFHAEAHVIEELAVAGSCVIVGRLANVVLKDRTYSLHLFISGDTDDRVTHVVEREGIDPRSAAEQVAKVDHERAEHCLFITHTRWGDALNYDISMNSSKYGIEGAGELLAHMAVAARDAGPRSAIS